MIKLKNYHLSILSIPEIRLCIEKAYEDKIPIYIVGGTLRDIILGFEVKDIDIVVEAPPEKFVKYISSLSIKGRLLKRFYTYKIDLSNNEIAHIDIAMARKETYPKPGMLPQVSSGSIEEDLFRRDFTINAFAAPLYLTGIGEIIDPIKGLKDLDSKIIRVLHNKSFIDDPTRIFRAVRFKVRLGFRIEPYTQKLIEEAIKSKTLSTVSNARINKEINLCLQEDRRIEILEELIKLGALPSNFIVPGN
jgi:tRNA nucleotidyltransferase (CCA-adding enzyme)